MAEDFGGRVLKQIIIIIPHWGIPGYVRVSHHSLHKNQNLIIAIDLFRGNNRKTATTSISK